MIPDAVDIPKVFKELFKEAETEGGLDYIFTLVRVNGLSYDVPDPFLELKSTLQTLPNNLSDERLITEYCSLTNFSEPLSLIANLINCTQKKPYCLSPYRHLYKGLFPNIDKPTTLQISRELSKIATESGKNEIAQFVDSAYSDDVLSAFLSGTNPNIDLLKTAYQSCYSFLKSLIEIYFLERLKFKNQPKLYKLRNFEVLELLVNDEYGLYGFKVYFSNGNSAVFERNTNSTEGNNITLNPIGFEVGDLGQLRDEWRVGEKRLYEIGLPGRYNKLGEWKPIIYPVNSEPLQREILSLSEDEDVQGVLFYMMCTGHRVIEFVVRTTIELPIESITFGEKFYLWKCPYVEGNVFVYDGWLELDSVKSEDIKSSIDKINKVVNLMTFAYGASVDWRLKYKMVSSSSGYATPSKEDLNLLKSIFQNFQCIEDVILNAAIDWFNRGSTSKNIFTKFLCFYIALESVAIAVAEGEADLGLDYSKGNKKEEQNKKKIECIKLKFDSIYSEDPIKFVERAYFDCVKSLTHNIKQVAELVFGPGHKYLKLLFEKQDGYSLTDIRGNIAHGKATIDEALVRNRIQEIKKISKEFLIRILFQLKPAAPLPSWSGSHRVSLLTTDPRTIMVTTTDKIFPKSDWKIRPEWCE